MCRPTSPLFFFFFAGNQVLLSCHHRIHHTAACASDAVTRCLTVVTSVLLQPRADRRTMALSRGGRKGLHERSRSPDPDSPRSPTRAHYSTPTPSLHSAIFFLQLLGDYEDRRAREGPLPFLFSAAALSRRVVLNFFHPSLFPPEKMMSATDGGACGGILE